MGGALLIDNLGSRLCLCLNRNRSKMGTSMMDLAIHLVICCKVITALSSAVWTPTQPKQNIWVTLANLTGQDALCLSTVSPGNPFTTFLVGQPLDNPLPNWFWGNIQHEQCS